MVAKAQKSIKIELQGLQNPSKKQLSSSSASEEGFEPPPFFRKIVIFERFLGPQIEPKSMKKCSKIRFEKNIFLKTIFYRIFVDLASENASKINHFFNIFQKRRFCKNCAPVEPGAQFLGFGASKKLPKNVSKRHSKTTSKKLAKKSNFGIHFGFQNRPRWLRKATQNEACFATLCKLPGSRRKLTGGSVCKASKWLGI